VKRAIAVAVSALLAAPGLTACPADRIEIETPAGVAAFAVEIADTPEARALGLMFRTDLERDAGMLFLFERAGPQTFWMKNTPLSLDMLFIAPDGRVCGLIERATPFSLDPRPSGCDALAVLEVHGGLAAEIGLRIGARTRHAAFGTEAAWPCDAPRPPAG
jgi:uncharacterized membrane protein (UPF0127 family)